MATQMTLFGEPVDIPPPKVTQKPARMTIDQAREAYEDWLEIGERYQDLHLWMLRKNLELIRDPNTGPKERADILAWVNQPRREKLTPLSFHACLICYDRRLQLDDMIEQVNRLNQRVLQRRHSLAS